MPARVSSSTHGSTPGVSLPRSFSWHELVFDPTFTNRLPFASMAKSGGRGAAVLPAAGVWRAGGRGGAGGGGGKGDGGPGEGPPGGELYWGGGGGGPPRLLRQRYPRNERAERPAAVPNEKLTTS